MTSRLMKIHRVEAGPFHTFDVVDDEGQYDGMDTYFIQCLVEVDGEMSSEELHFDEWKDVYEIQNHLARNIEPFEVEMEDFEEVDTE